MKIEIEVEDIKMLREALCLAQSAVNQRGYYTEDFTRRVSDRLGQVIVELDKHRPLGSDGKHDDRHTDTCGCDVVLICS